MCVIFLVDNVGKTSELILYIACVRACMYNLIVWFCSNSVILYVLYSCVCCCEIKVNTMKRGHVLLSVTKNCCNKKWTKEVTLNISCKNGEAIYTVSEEEGY